jgi:dihydrofolate reductase
LIDEVILIVYPVLLGRGKRLLSDSFDARELEFVDSKITPTGLLINTYKHLGPLKK